MFYLGDTQIENVAIFKYLGRCLSFDDSDLPAIRANIRKARERWAQFSRILTREGADISSMTTFYKTIIASILLFGSETWCPTEREWQLLEAFHNKCARHITKRWLSPNDDGTWECPETQETLRTANLETIRAYVTKRKIKMMRYAEHRAIYRKCLRTTRTPRASHKVTWWPSSL